MSINVGDDDMVPIDASLRVAAPGRLSFRIGPEEPDRVPTTTGIGPERTSIFALHMSAVDPKRTLLNPSKIPN
jgi:hypothetical protein